MERSDLGTRFPISPLRDQVARIEQADREYTRMTAGGRTTCPVCSGVGMAGKPHHDQSLLLWGIVEFCSGGTPSA